MGDVSVAQSRRLLMATSRLVRPLPDTDLMPEELRAAVVLFASLLDDRQRRLFAGLESEHITERRERYQPVAIGGDRVPLATEHFNWLTWTTAALLRPGVRVGGPVHRHSRRREEDGGGWWTLTAAVLRAGPVAGPLRRRVHAHRGGLAMPPQSRNILRSPRGQNPSVLALRDVHRPGTVGYHSPTNVNRPSIQDRFKSSSYR